MAINRKIQKIPEQSLVMIHKAHYLGKWAEWLFIILNFSVRYQFQQNWGWIICQDYG